MSKIVLGIILFCFSIARADWIAPPTEFYSESNSPHLVLPLITGPAALEQRMRMIESAKRSIDLRYFIFEPDDTTRQILQALAKRTHNPGPSKRIQVRLLIDYAGMSGSPALNKWEAQVIQDTGIKLKFYNTSKLSLKFLNRDHGKLFVKDGEEFIAGGRNMSSQYFDPQDPHYYLDYDIWVKGDTGRAAQANFDAFWNSPLSLTPKPLSLPPKGSRDDKARAKAAWIFVANERDGLFSSRMRSEGKTDLDAMDPITANDVTFAADKPLNDHFNRVVTSIIDRLLAETQNSLIMENTCLQLRDEQATIIQNLLMRGVQMQLTINQAGEMEVGGILGKIADAADWRYIESREYSPYTWKMKIFLLAPGKVEIHSKALTRDHKDTLVSSYNFDPRSKLENSEIAVLVKDTPELARQIETAMNARNAGTFLYRPDRGNGLLDTSQVTSKNNFEDKILDDGGRLLTPLVYKIIQNQM